MKIAMLGHKRIPSREGGVEVVVEELTNPDEIKYIWGEFKKIYDENFGKQ